MLEYSVKLISKIGKYIGIILNTTIVFNLINGH